MAKLNWHQLCLASAQKRVKNAVCRDRIPPYHASADLMFFSSGPKLVLIVCLSHRGDWRVSRCRRLGDLYRSVKRRLGTAYFIVWHTNLSLTWTNLKQSRIEITRRYFGSAGYPTTSRACNDLAQPNVFWSGWRAYSSQWQIEQQLGFTIHSITFLHNTKSP